MSTNKVLAIIDRNSAAVEELANAVREADPKAMHQTVRTALNGALSELKQAARNAEQAATKSQSAAAGAAAVGHRLSSLFTQRRILIVLITFLIGFLTGFAASPFAMPNLLIRAALGQKNICEMIGGGWFEPKNGTPPYCYFMSRGD